MTKTDAVDVVIAAVRELEQSGVILGVPRLLTANTLLFGPGGFVDSLGLVQIAVETERLVAEKYGAAIAIADERAMSRLQSPFRSVGSLADYVTELLEGE
jgi:acyl carrier protein